MTISTDISKIKSWTGSSGNTYEIYKSLATWGEASTFARSKGGYLVKIDNSIENEELFNQLKANLTVAELNQSRASDGGDSSYVWLGASDVVTEGNWIWDRDSTTVSVSRDEWGKGLLGTEPDNFQGSQNYLALGMETWPKGVGFGQGYGDAGEWNDLNGFNRLYFVVETEIKEEHNKNLNEVTATAGNETFQGVNGKINVVKQSASYTNFTVEKVGSTIFLTDKSGLGGKDTLLGIERVKFSDLAIAFDTDGAISAGGIYRLYKATFDRVPDTAGLGYWIAQADAGNKDAVRMAEDFTWSQEFQALYDIKTNDNYGTGTDVKALVTGFYENVLGRTPDQGGLNFYTDVIQSKERTVGRVLAEISDSQENYNGTIDLIATGIAYTPFVG